MNFWSNYPFSRVLIPFLLGLILEIYFPTFTPNHFYVSVFLLAGFLITFLKFFTHNNGKAGGGPLNILWNYLRGNNSYNGEEDLIYARTVVSIAILSFVWIMINKFL